MAGEVPLTLSAPGPLMPLFRDGRLRPVAIAASKRSGLTPDIPTLAELGLPDISLGYAFSLAGPAGMHPAIVQKLFDASNLALADPAVRARLLNLGYEPAPAGSVAEFQQSAIEAGRDLRRTVEALRIKGVE